MTPPPKQKQPLPVQSAERKLTDEEHQRFIQIMTKYVHLRGELGKAERAWHRAGASFYDSEDEMKRFEEEMVKRYTLLPTESIDPMTGKIVKKR